MAQQRRRILITGISGTLAGELARRLEQDERVEHLVGLDSRQPRGDLERTELVRADLRHPLIAKVLATHRIDTLVHLALVSTPSQVGGRSRMKDHNVIGAMQLLAAAQRARTVQSVVLRSTTAVYGSHPTSPGLIREDAAIDDERRGGLTHDVVEVERYARDLRRQRPDIRLGVLRFASVIGPSIDSVLTRYLALPVVPTALGYDPRLQLCHQDDAVAVLHRATIDQVPGTYNVAGPGVVYLSQALRRLGRPAAGVPPALARPVAWAAKRAADLDLAEDQLPFLQFGRVGDITRLRETFGYEPRASTAEALESFAATGRVRPLVDAEAAARFERTLRGLLPAPPTTTGPTESAATTTASTTTAAPAPGASP